mmetsp:Transcript_33243/g.69246  ORF Transcript_33243/g.69246 Transcript_33243/m.69246 type:complete len:200 (+) Transcript_33243:502-1101(+)
MLFRIFIVLVVEEDSSQSSGFSSVLDDKVAIGPSLEFFIVFGVMLVANLLVSSMEVLHVIFVNIRGGDIGTTTKPPNTTIGFKVSVVKMHGRSKRVLWVHHTGKTTGKEGNTFSRGHALGAINTTFGGSLESFLGHATVNNRKIDSSLFKDLSPSQDTRHTASAIFASPTILLERSFSVDFFNSFGDADLRFTDHLFKF